MSFFVFVLKDDYTIFLRFWAFLFAYFCKKSYYFEVKHTFLFLQLHLLLISFLFHFTYYLSLFEYFFISDSRYLTTFNHFYHRKSYDNHSYFSYFQLLLLYHPCYFYNSFFFLRIRLLYLPLSQALNPHFSYD